MGYLTDRGLLKRHKSEPGAIENEFLFGLEYWLLLREHDFNEEANEMHKKLYDFIQEAAKDQGNGTVIMENHIDKAVLERNPEISHDQLTAYSVYSILTGKRYHKVIWDGIKKFHYDGRFVHPRDWIFYGLLNGDWRAKALSPLLRLMLWFTFKRHWTVRKKGHREFKNYYGEVYLKTYQHRTFIKDSNEMLWWVRMRGLHKVYNGEGLYLRFLKTAEKGCERRFKTCRLLWENYYNWDFSHPNLAERFKHVVWSQ